MPLGGGNQHVFVREALSLFRVEQVSRVVKLGHRHARVRILLSSIPASYSARSPARCSL
jgi:hypothetical protein